MTIEDRLREFAPSVQPPTISGGDVLYAVHEFAVGPMLIAVRPDGLLIASRYIADGENALLERLARTVSPRVVRSARATDPVRRQLDDYLAGRRRRFEVDVDTVLATPFQRAVLTRLAADVGYGSRTSYAGLAAAIGHPRAARAVGAALGANPLCVVLPCHRVVAADGSLTGYAGGLAAKRLLLALESS